jgi:hypothetical protein
MSTLIIGNDHEYTSVAGDPTYNFGGGYTDTYAFDALATASLNRLEFWFDHFATGTFTTLYAGVYADVSGEPGALLGSASTTGPFTDNSWISVSGLNVAMVSGQTYHLAILGLSGTGVFRYDQVATVPTHSSGGTSSSLPSPWDATGEYAYTTGVLPGIRGYSDGATIDPTGLEFHLTGVHTPDGDAPYYGRIADPQSGSEVVIPLNDGRTASVTMSAYDPVVEVLAGLTQIPYAVMLKVYYRGALVFWGPVKVQSIDMAAGTVRLDAVDMTLRLANHFLRRGDLVLSGQLDENNQDQGYVEVSGAGLSALIDAAETASFPTLGIDLGVDSYTVDPDRSVGASRGANVYEIWQAVAAALGPDWELEPIETVSQFYARLNTVDHQGSDKSAIVVFHYGVGRQNLEGLQVVEGEEYCNFAHVLDRDQKFELPVVNSTALARTGPYIRWEATDFEAANGLTDAQVEDVLTAHGEDVIAAYGHPSLALTLTLPVDAEDSQRYLDDFIVGDTVGVAGKVGFVRLPEYGYRITQVALRLDNEQVRTSLEVVADRTAGETPSTDDPEVG